MKIRKLAVLLFAVALLSTQSAALAEEGRGGAGPSGVMFNFVDVDLGAVAQFVSDITGKNFIFDERVRGKVTIIAPSELSVDDAFKLFTSVLRLKGFTVVPSGVEAYKIIPVKEARQSGVEVMVDRPPVDESYIARLIQLENISSDDALKFVQPVVSSDGYISSFGPGNQLLVVDSGLNVEKVLGIMSAIDKPQVGEEPEVVFLAHAGADDIVAVLDAEQKRTRGKKPEAAEPRVIADQRLNAVVLFGRKNDRETMKRLISLLDVPAEEAFSSINVYFLENADATELADVLQKLTAARPQGKQAGDGKSPLPAISDLSITPDKATNSLIVVASPADYQSLLKVIAQLDRKRRQVYVEAMIVEASVDGLRQLGSRWRAIARSGGEPVVIGGVGSIDTSAIQTILSGLSGLSVGGLGNFMSVPVTQPDGSVVDLTVPGYAALFSLSDFSDVLDVLSMPQILTSDNVEAEIVVGENVPFIGQQERDITTTNTVLSSIERTDVGITLRIKPHITQGDTVKLDVYQEISSVKDTPAGVDPTTVLTTVGPTTVKRSTKTTVALKNNQTVVIGGLMQERQLKTTTKVPVLGDIPVLGWLFKHRTTSTDKTNLLVFLTPRIIEEADMASITEEKKEEFARKGERFVEGECIVRFKPGVTEEQAAALIEEKWATVIKRYENLNLYHLKIRRGISVERAVREFQELPEVQYAEPNYIFGINGGDARGLEKP